MTLLKSGQGIETWREGPLLVKRVDLDPSTARQLAYEARLLAELDLEHTQVHPDRLIRPWLDGPTLAEHPLRDLTPFLHLLRQLERAHARGVLHLNLKPENLVLTPAGLQPIDFGLARFTRLRGRLADLPLEDVQYLAPEVTGVVRAAVGPESDLYSVGALMHRALTGSAPYTGESTSEVLHATLAAPVPTRAGDLVERLLARSPRDRYSRASEVLEALEGGLAGPSRSFRESPFVGRTHELELLTQERGVSLIVGEAGVGKSRLLQELGLRHSWTLHSAARPEPRPLQLFAGFIGELVHRGQHLPLGPYAGLLAGAFPELQPVLGPPSDGPPSQLAAALVRLVHGLEGACLLLDDLQWADEPSLEALRRLHLDPPPGVRVVAACRPFAGLPLVPTLQLRPLQPEASRELLRSMGLEGGRVEELCQLAEGNPLLLVEGMRGGAVGEGAAELLMRRLDAFRQPVLESVAVLGTAARAPAIAQVLAADPAEGLEEARRAGLLWRDTDHVFHFAHDRLRETVLARLENPTALHTRAAQYHEELEEPGPAALHWTAAQNPERAAPLALAAARASRARLDHATALEFYALTSAPAHEVAECLRVAGRRREAYERAGEGLQRASTPLEQARLLTIQGRACQDMDDIVEAERLLREALSQLTVLGPKLAWWKLFVPFRTHAPGKGSADPEAALALNLVHQLMQVLAHNGRTWQVLGLMRQAAHLAQRCPELPESGVLAASVCALQVLLGLRGAALETARHARALLHRTEPYTRGRGRARAAMVEWGRPLDATLRSSQLVIDDLSQGSADPFEISIARFVHGLHLVAAGRLTEAQAIGQDIVRRCQETDDSLFLGLGLTVWAYATHGDVPPEQMERAVARPGGGAFQKVQLHLSQAIVALGAGQPLRAVALLTETEFVGPSPPDLAMLLYWRCVAARQAAEATGEERYYRMARRCVRPLLGRGLSWFGLTRLPALREAGLLAAARGHVLRARRWLDEAVSEAVRCDAWYEAAQSRLAWGRTGLALGWKGAEDELERARHDLRQMGATWFLNPPPDDPVQAVLEWGRQLAAQPARLDEAVAQLPEVARFFESVASSATLNASREEVQAEARRQVLAQEEQLRALFGAAGVGMVVASSGVVVNENDTFRSWAGTSWVGRAVPGPGEHELSAGLLSRWTASPDGRLYTVTLLAHLEDVAAAQAASRAGREARLDRLRGRLVSLGLSVGKLGLVGGETLDLPVELDRPLPSIIARTLQRLVQEALSNARRHAPGAAVRVSVRCEDGWVLGSVTDDGPGFTPALVSGRLGLRGMQWRARFCGGECTVESSPGKGTTVRFRLPL